MASKFDNRAVIRTPGYSTFDLSFRSRATVIMGDLVPVLSKEVVPGDHFKASLAHLVRLAPLQAPVFDDCRVDFHSFFVPNRIIDPEWKRFITGGVGLAGTSDEDIMPLSFKMASIIGKEVPATGYQHKAGSVSSLADYLNFHFYMYGTGENQYPMLQATYSEVAEETFSALPFLAYHKIWDDWFRNERLEQEYLLQIFNILGENNRVFDYDPGTEGPTRLLYDMHKRNYAKDKYTTSLPEPVVGGPVTIPGGVDPDQQYPVKSTAEITSASGVASNEQGNVSVPSASANLFVQLTSAAQATIQQLKTAFAMYSFFMKDTYNGNRYVEFIESHFNKRVPDSTLDRAIYLGKLSGAISYGEVFQTSEGDGSESGGRLGNYAGRGVAAGQGNLFNQEFLEHGWLFTILSIVPRATYFQGVDPKFLKNSRWDFFFPEFQDIGDEAIKTIELFNAGVDQQGHSLYDTVFGYNTRWSEYKTFTNELHGDFLTNMRFWTLSRQFVDPPVISPAFSNVPVINNPFVQIDEFSDNYMVDMYFNIVASRPMKKYENF